MTILIRLVACLALLGLSSLNTHIAQGTRNSNTCIQYATVRRPDALRKLCVNLEAIQAAQRGQTLPIGTTIRMAVYDPTGQHPLGPTSLRSKSSEGWHYTEMVGGGDACRDAKSCVSTITTTTTHDNPTCIACHSAVKDQDYLFSLPQLLAYAKTGQVQTVVCNRLGRRPCGTQGK